MPRSVGLEEVERQVRGADLLPLPLSPFSLSSPPENFASVNDDDVDDDDDDDDDDDLYIIGAVCVSVCLCVCQQKSLFLYSKDFYSFIPYSMELVVSMFLDTFCIQRIWTFPMFIYTFCNQKYSKNLVKSPVSVHFPSSKVSRKSKTTKSLEVFKEFGQFFRF